MLFKFKDKNFNSLIIISLILLIIFILIDFVLLKLNPNFINILITFKKFVYWPFVLIIIGLIIYKSVQQLKIKHVNKKQIYFLILIISIAMFLRVYDLDMMHLNLDESAAFLTSAKDMKYNGFFNDSEKRMVYYAGLPIGSKDGALSPLLPILVFINLHFFDDPILAVRGISVFFGVLTILLTFLFARSLYGDKVGLLSALFLALLPWHIIQSRLGMEIILGPLFGLLIFYPFYISLKQKNKNFFFLSVFFLGVGSFYTYPGLRIFLAVFLVLLFLIYDKLKWLKLKDIMMATIIFLFLFYPHIVLTNITNYEMNQHLLTRLDLEYFDYFGNLKNIFESLFIDDKSFLYGSSLYGSLIPFTLLFFISLSAIRFLFRRKIKDFILIAWMLAPIFLISFSEVLQARYLFMMLPAPLILCAKAIQDISKITLNKKNLIFILISIFALIFIGFQLITYFKIAPNQWDNLMNSYGVSEAAEFLYGDIKDDNFLILESFRMDIKPQLEYLYFLDDKKDTWSVLGDKVFWEFEIKKKKVLDLEKSIKDSNTVLYYVVWDPSTHDPKFYQDFYEGYNFFKTIHPNIRPIKIVYYPNGKAAIQIFKV